jgi:hypothetical protein
MILTTISDVGLVPIPIPKFKPRNVLRSFSESKYRQSVSAAKLCVSQVLDVPFSGRVVAYYFPLQKLSYSEPTSVFLAKSLPPGQVGFSDAWCSISCQHPAISLSVLISNLCHAFKGTCQVFHSSIPFSPGPCDECQQKLGGEILSRRSFPNEVTGSRELIDVLDSDCLLHPNLIYAGQRKVRILIVRLFEKKV